MNTNLTAARNYFVKAFAFRLISIRNTARWNERNNTWCHWCSPSGPGTWAEPAGALHCHQEAPCEYPTPTPVPLCSHSAGTCPTWTNNHERTKKNNENWSQSTQLKKDRQKSWMNSSEIRYEDQAAVLSHIWNSIRLFRFWLGCNCHTFIYVQHDTFITV